jgi:hypothetical protein
VGGVEKSGYIVIVKDTTVDGAEQTAGESLDEREQHDTQVSANQPEIQDHIRQAIAALQAIDEGLNAT